jgi:ribosomal protein S18 acetylase RimI-like enzyme
MRRDLTQPANGAQWPAPLRLTEFSIENARAVHQLLVLGRSFGGGRVADFTTWLDAFDNDPEFDRQLCFAVEDPQGIVAVAQCWTSAFIRNLVVHPRAQRCGLGLTLLAEVFDAFRARGEGHVDLKVMECNLPARHLYERAGMQYLQRRELDPR